MPTCTRPSTSTWSSATRKLGDLGRARQHLQHARDTIGALGDDQYGQLIRSGLEQLAERLDQS